MTVKLDIIQKNNGRAIYKISSNIILSKDFACYLENYNYSFLKKYFKIGILYAYSNDLILCGFFDKNIFTVNCRNLPVDFKDISLSHKEALDELMKILENYGC